MGEWSASDAAGCVGEAVEMGCSSTSQNPPRLGAVKDHLKIAENIFGALKNASGNGQQSVSSLLENCLRKCGTCHISEQLKVNSEQVAR